MSPANRPEAAEIIAQLRSEYGMSRGDIARELGRDPRMVSKIERGETSGSHYVAALEELRDTGRLRTPPPRRRGADGHVVPVRAQGNARRVPEEPTPPRRGQFSQDVTYLPHRGRHVIVEMPRSEGVGRERARDAVMAALRSAAKGQAHQTRYVRFQLGLRNGRRIEVGAKGGYRVSTALQGARAEGNDPLAWLAQQRDEMYEELDESGSEVTSVEIVVYGTSA